MELVPKVTGRVLWFSRVRGYGFLADEIGSEVLVHDRSVQAHGKKMLARGDAVEFDVISGETGPEAVRVLHIQPRS